MATATDGAKPREWRSLEAIRHDARAGELVSIDSALVALADRANRQGLPPENFDDIRRLMLVAGGESMASAESANTESLALYAGVTDEDYQDSWATGWIFPKGTTESAARDWLAEVECIALDATPLAAHSPTGRWIHEAVWFERRPSGRLFARQSGGLDT